MSKYTVVDDKLYEYLLAQRTPDDALLVELREETQRMPVNQAQMQISAEQGAFFTLLARLMGARQALEVGTFTGYSSICVARGLAPGGRLLAFDVNKEFTDVARRYWRRAGLEDRIELRLGPALESLRALPPDPVFDLAFIDADKGGYLAYYEEILARMRPGGLIMADNVLWRGRVADPSAQEPEAVAIRQFNASVAADTRVDVVLLTIADGLLLAHKR